MNPSAPAVAAIVARVATIPGGFPGNSDAQLAGFLNAPTVANPAPQAQVPRPFTASDLVSAAAPSSRQALGPVLSGAAAALIVGQDAPHLAAGLDALALVGTITAVDQAAMKAVLAQTLPDPAYRPQLGWAEATLGRPVDAADLAAARSA